MIDLAPVREADAALAALDPKPFPLPVAGLESVVAGSLAGLGRGDWWVPGLRERVGAVQRGVAVERLVDPTQGARPYKVAPATASPALRALYAVGLALADRERAALVHLGIGSMADGAIHEALNLAALYQPTVIFMVAVHPLKGDAPLAEQLATTPSALATAFGVRTSTVDGTDADAIRTSVEEALHHKGPHLIQAMLETTS